MSGMDYVDIAKRIAYRAHARQVDKAGAPYICHPIRVAHSLQGQKAGDVAVAAGYLHDVLEDTDETVESLAARGIPSDVVDVVVLLTRTDDVAPDDYYAAIARDPIARLVKIADVLDNAAPERLEFLDERTRERLRRKYDKALSLLV